MHHTCVRDASHVCVMHRMCVLHAPHVCAACIRCVCVMHQMCVLHISHVVLDVSHVLPGFRACLRLVCGTCKNTEWHWVSNTSHLQMFCVCLLIGIFCSLCVSHYRARLRNIWIHTPEIGCRARHIGDSTIDCWLKMPFLRKCMHIDTHEWMEVYIYVCVHTCMYIY